jgi:hypothetical protein
LTDRGAQHVRPRAGSWGDEAWTGWWGDDPPFHTPVFVLTHHAREPLEMQGGTTFHFVTDGIETALERAVHVVSVLLGGGSRLFENLAGGPSGYEPVGHVSSSAAAHYTYLAK